jgi:hypothetical protein
MLIREQVAHAVHLHACGYQLLRWLEKALGDGVISPEAAGAYATSEEGAYAWLDRYYVSLPAKARPDRAHLRAFGNLFSTYLDSTFDLDVRPGERLYSPDAHCFCPFCSWMVRKPHLRPKKVGPADKKAAERMKRAFLTRLAASHGMSVFGGTLDERLDEMLQDPALREPAGLCAYAADLLQRLEGRAAGAATLALWRTFAWTAQGSPKQGFVLTADEIMSAQDVLTKRLLQTQSSI